MTNERWSIRHSRQYFVLSTASVVRSAPLSLLAFSLVIGIWSFGRRLPAIYDVCLIAGLEESRLGSQPCYNPHDLPNRYGCCDRNLLANDIGGGFMLDTLPPVFV